MSLFEQYLANMKNMGADRSKDLLAAQYIINSLIDTLDEQGKHHAFTLLKNQGAPIPKTLTYDYEKQTFYPWVLS